MKKAIIGIALFLSSGCICFANQYESLGDAIQWALPTTALGMTIWKKDPDGRMMFYKSFGATTAITYGAKVSVNRTRPNGADHSFPSGHTSASFSSAMYIHRRYGYKTGRLAYLGAIFVGWSRIQANKHYTTDVLAGAAVGTLSSFLLTTSENVDLGAYKDGDSSGININIRW